MVKIGSFTEFPQIKYRFKSLKADYKAAVVVAPAFSLYKSISKLISRIPFK